jgi:hypothetical protein
MSNGALRGAVGTAAVAGWAILAMPGAAMAAEQPPESCTELFDAYTASAERLKECDIPSYPLTKMEQDRWGGTSYVYDVPGTPATWHIPPSDFDPVTASQEERDTYGVKAPPKDKDSAAYADWVKKVSHLHYVDPPGALHSLPITASGPSGDNWSGMVNTGGPYTSSWGTWTEPTRGTTSCSGSTEATWVGLGGYGAGTALAQNGTIIDGGTGTQHQAWWLVLPNPTNHGLVTVPMTATPGSGFKATTDRTATGYQFSFFNTYDEDIINETVVSDQYTGTTSDFIVERATLSSGGVSWFSALTNFGTIPWVEALSNSVPAATLPSAQLQMFGASPPGNLLASTGPWNPSQGFTSYYKNCL